MKDLTIEDKRRILRSIIVWACYHNEKEIDSWCAYVMVPAINVDDWEFTTDYDYFPKFTCYGRHENDKHEDCPLPDMKFDEFTDEQIEQVFNTLPQQYLEYSHEAIRELWNNINEMTKIYNDKERYWEEVWKNRG